MTAVPQEPTTLGLLDVPLVTAMSMDLGTTFVMPRLVSVCVSTTWAPVTVVSARLDTGDSPSVGLVTVTAMQKPVMT